MFFSTLDEMKIIILEKVLSCILFEKASEYSHLIEQNFQSIRGEKVKSTLSLMEFRGICRNGI